MKPDRRLSEDGMIAGRATNVTGRRRAGAARFAVPLAAFAGGVAAAVFLSQARQEPWPAVYRQEAISVVADRAGRVASIDAASGGDVRPGDALASIDDRSVAVVSRLRDDAARLRAEFDRATARAALDASIRIEPLERERLDTRLRYADLLRQRFDADLRMQALGDAAEVRRIGHETDAAEPLRRRLDLADATNAREVIVTQIALCEERLAALDRLVTAVPGQIERAAGLDRLRQEQSAAESRVAAAGDGAPAAVVSPAFGRVGVYRRKVGDTVAAGETLLEVFDAARPYLLLTIPVSDLSRFAPGRRVTVSFPNVEDRKPFAGTVGEVASEAETDSSTATTPGATTARVRIDPSGRLWPPLPPGATALVTPSRE